MFAEARIRQERGQQILLRMPQPAAKNFFCDAKLAEQSVYIALSAHL
jgi:hypothetical protein